MAKIIVRKLEKDFRARLERRAARNGRSLEDEARHILREAVKGENQPAPGLGSRIAARFRKPPLPGELPELRREPPRVPDFRE